MARLSDDSTLRTALALSLALFLVGSSLGYLAVGEAFVERTSADGLLPVAGSLQAILVANLGAALLLYSGALTLGLSTVVALLMLGTYVGATMKVGVVTSGWSGLLGDVGLYAPAEFAGLVAVAAAGLYPLAASFRRVDGPHQAAPGRYVAAVPRSLVLLGVGLCLVLAAATAEALLIDSR